MNHTREAWNPKSHVLTNTQHRSTSMQSLVHANDSGPDRPNPGRFTITVIHCKEILVWTRVFRMSKITPLSVTKMTIQYTFVGMTTHPKTYECLLPVWRLLRQHVNEFIDTSTMSRTWQPFRSLVCQWFHEGVHVAVVTHTRTPKQANS